MARASTAPRKAGASLKTASARRISTVPRAVGRSQQPHQREESSGPNPAGQRRPPVYGDDEDDPRFGNVQGPRTFVPSTSGGLLGSFDGDGHHRADRRLSRFTSMRVGDMFFSFDGDSYEAVLHTMDRANFQSTLASVELLDVNLGRAWQDAAASGTKPPQRPPWEAADTGDDGSSSASAPSSGHSQDSSLRRPAADLSLD